MSNDKSNALVLELWAKISMMMGDGTLDARAVAESFQVILDQQNHNDSDGVPDLLCAHRGDDGRWLRMYDGRPGNWWVCDDGCAFAVSQNQFLT